jgi:hypothetical protein
MNHPAYPELLRRYRHARQMWQRNPDVQAAAARLGMSEWEYCHAVVAGMGPLLWTGTTNTTQVDDLTHEQYWRAFEEAQV